MGGTAVDCFLKIAAHAHAQAGQTVAPGNVTQQFKMPARRFFEGWNAHETGDGEPGPTTAKGYETVRPIRKDACLLRFAAGIDLNEELRVPALPGVLGGDGLSDLWPVNGVDGVEKGSRFARLVTLQGPD